MHEYFQIIRQALSEGRKKGITYYEAHHIVPRSFGKQSSTVLLTPEEHYRCHKLLAEYFKQHSVYGKKMLWAFHRISYDGKHKLTEEQYGEARRILQSLWKADKTDAHKENIRKTRVGKKTIVHPGTNEIKYVLTEELQEWINQGWENTNYRKGTSFSQDHKDNIRKTRAGKKTIVHPGTNEIKYVLTEELQEWINQGWENTNYKKGRTGLISEEGSRKLAEARRREQTGKTGLSAQAAKGPYTVEFQDGRKYTEGSYPQLSKTVNIPLVTLQYRYVHKKGQMLKGWAIY